MAFKRFSTTFLLTLFLSWSLLSGFAQPPDPSLVRFTEARSYRVTQRVQLSGTVESRLVSSVAAEIAGLVTEYPAREGNSVSAGDVLARLRTESLRLQLAAMEAQLNEEEARRKLAERIMVRARQLYESDAYSRQQLDEAQFEFDARQGRTDQLQAEIARLQDDLERSVIRAPFAGIIIREHTEVGEWLEVGSPVVDLLSQRELEVSLQLPERYFGRIRLNTPARITFEALPQRRFEGTVSAVIPNADIQARTFPLKVRFRNTSDKIGIGMLAQVELPVGEASQSIIVPKDAVVLQGTERIVFIIDENGSVRRRAVSTGSGVGQWVEVTEGIQAGERVVTRGNERLQEGQQVVAQILEYPLP